MSFLDPTTQLFFTSTSHGGVVVVWKDKNVVVQGVACHSSYP